MNILIDRICSVQRNTEYATGSMGMIVSPTFNGSIQCIYSGVTADTYPDINGTEVSDDTVIKDGTSLWKVITNVQKATIQLSNISDTINSKTDSDDSSSSDNPDNTDNTDSDITTDTNNNVVLFSTSDIIDGQGTNLDNLTAGYYLADISLDNTGLFTLFDEKEAYITTMSATVDITDPDDSSGLLTVKSTSMKQLAMGKTDSNNIATRYKINDTWSNWSALVTLETVNQLIADNTSFVTASDEAAISSIVNKVINNRFVTCTLNEYNAMDKKSDVFYILTN